MKDNEARGLVLKQLYDLRHTGTLLRMDEHLLNLRDTLGTVPLVNIIKQLQEKSLVEYHPQGRHSIRLTGLGVDVVEGTKESPISVNIDHSISVTGSSHVQIGQGNIQNVTDFEKLNLAIDHSDASQSEKAEAKSLLEKVSNNRLVLAILKKFGLNVG